MVQKNSANPPKNPFLGEKETDTSLLSDLQKKVANYVQKEAREKIIRTYGFQPPSIKIFGPDAEQEKRETEQKEKEFLDKYKISKIEHDLLVNLIFYGKIKMNYVAFGHTFTIRDIDPETRRFINEISQQIIVPKVASMLKIKAVSKSLLEIDSVPVDSLFLEKYLWQMQNKMLDIFYQMYLITERYKMYLYEKLPNFSRTPTSRARYAICNDMNITINNPLFNTMSEEQIYWHYINTVKNQEIENENINSKLEYLAWFINPEMAKKVKEKKESDFEADTNMVQRYSFIDGIMDLMKNDMSPAELSSTMQELMTKMSDPTIGKSSKDPWDEPSELQQMQEVGSFIKTAAKTKPNLSKYPEDHISRDEGQVGMFGGNKNWYKNGK
jgi:hypothetical protein